MANTLTNTKANNARIQMSNGLTSVFTETICLAGSDIAVENYQKDQMIWFGQRDWMLVGMGLEGFDIVEMMWDKENFEEQQKFILHVIDRATKKTNWELLEYEPHEMIFKTLTEFKQMICDFKKEFIETEKTIGIFDFDGTVKRYDKCNKHKIFKHVNGCVICNNAPIENK